MSDLMNCTPEEGSVCSLTYFVVDLLFFTLNISVSIDVQYFSISHATCPNVPSDIYLMDRSS